MFINSIKFYLRFNWIYGGFDCKKNRFLSQFRLLLDEIKVLEFKFLSQFRLLLDEIKVLGSKLGA
jgi:hypothetical protein